MDNTLFGYHCSSILLGDVCCGTTLVRNSKRKGSKTLYIFFAFVWTGNTSYVAFTCIFVPYYHFFEDLLYRRYQLFRSTPSYPRKKPLYKLLLITLFSKPSAVFIPDTHVSSECERPTFQALHRWRCSFHCNHCTVCTYNSIIALKLRRAPVGQSLNSQHCIVPV